MRMQASRCALGDFVVQLCAVSVRTVECRGLSGATLASRRIRGAELGGSVLPRRRPARGHASRASTGRCSRGPCRGRSCSVHGVGAAARAELSRARGMLPITT